MGRDSGRRLVPRGGRARQRCVNSGSGSTTLGHGPATKWRSRGSAGADLNTSPPFPYAGRLGEGPCGEESSVAISFSPHPSAGRPRVGGCGEESFVLTRFSPSPPSGSGRVSRRCVVARRQRTRVSRDCHRTALTAAPGARPRPRRPPPPQAPAPAAGARPRPTREAPRPTREAPRPQRQRSRRGASRMRISRAGTPPTTALAGTSAATTAFVPTTLLSPTVTPRRMQAP